MSIKSKVLKEIRQKPRRLKELKTKIGNNRKVAAALRELLAEGAIAQSEGAYRLAEPPTAGAAGAAGMAAGAAAGVAGTAAGVAGTAAGVTGVPQGIPCKLVKLAARFGFAQRMDGEGDIFVPGRSLLGAMPGDEIAVKLFDQPRVPGSQEGEVVAITKPCNTFVGTVMQLSNGMLALEPDRCAGILLAIKRGEDGGAKPGEKAAVEIVTRSEHHDGHLAKVTVRFGDANSARECAKAVLYDHDVRSKFPEAVRDEAHSLPEKLSEKEIARRTDLRALPIFTIDSAETKDIDDAISLAKTAGGYELGVHIADVSYYVRPDTALDDEAFRRGTSVYYADSVAPMLPKQLSNGVCSLNEGEDRFAFSCLMQLDQKGVLQSYRFVKTVIRSRVKGVYSEINTILDGTAELSVEKKYAPVSAQFAEMKKLYTLRTALRAARGGMELESAEAKLILNEDGVCVGLKKRARGVSECMIEEFMLLANECAANLARTQKLPFVYRVHEAPDAEKAGRLLEMLTACGINAHFAAAAPTQTELNAVLAGVRGSKLERTVNTGVLRSMQKAKYEPTPKGHFGLALLDYAHFTSPIRRYPDLSIHRILSDYLAGSAAGELHAKYDAFAAASSKQSSAQEMEAMQVERAVEDLYKAEYLSQHLGESFPGTISGVTARGVFVELENTAEGFVPADQFCRGEAVLTEGVRLSDPLSGQCWMLGDEMMVTVAKADVSMGRVDFVPAKADNAENAAESTAESTEE